jgi:hypothetical protein
LIEGLFIDEFSPSLAKAIAELMILPGSPAICETVTPKRPALKSEGWARLAV